MRVARPRLHPFLTIELDQGATRRGEGTLQFVERFRATTPVPHRSATAATLAQRACARRRTAGNSIDHLRFKFTMNINTSFPTDEMDFNCFARQVAIVRSCPLFRIGRNDPHVK
jgi:hypothetical protein